MNNTVFKTFVEKWVDREYLPKTVAPGPLEKAEKDLGILPLAYRQFLLTYGWVQVESPRLVESLLTTRSSLDPIHEFVSPFDMPGLTQQLRGAGLKRGLVPIATDGRGNYYCVRSKAVRVSAREPDAPVWIYDHDERQCELIKESFVDWLADYAALPVR